MNDYRKLFFELLDLTDNVLKLQEEYFELKRKGPRDVAWAKLEEAKKRERELREYVQRHKSGQGSLFDERGELD